MIVGTITTLSDYENLYGRCDLRPSEFDAIWQYYDDENETYNIDEDGKLEDNWTCYDSIEDAAEALIPDEYESLKEEYDNDEITYYTFSRLLSQYLESDYTFRLTSVGGVVVLD